MAYATYLHSGTSHVGEIQGTQLVPFSGAAELGIATPPDFLSSAVRDESATVPIAEVTFRPVVPNPSKVFCVVLNYRDHIAETKRELPKYPVLFPKYASSLLGPQDDIVLPRESSQPDYEGEMAVVIGRGGRRISEANAVDHVLGYTVANDVTMRDFQYKTHIPGGVGYRHDPQLFLSDGDRISVEIDGIGAITNTVRRPT